MSYGIVFDLDGTLVDTAPAIIAAANPILAQYGLEPLDACADREIAMQGRRAIIQHSLRKSVQTVDKMRADQLEKFLYPILLLDYERNPAGASRLFTGVTACLVRLAAAGWTLGVCTNSDRYVADRLLTAFGIRDLFTTIVAGDMVVRRKPDPRHLLETMKKMCVDPFSAIYIGDSRIDEDAALDAGVVFVCANWYGLHASLSPYSFSDCRELYAVVAQIGYTKRWYGCAEGAEDAANRTFS